MFLNGSLGPQYIGRCFLLSRGSLFCVHDTPENISGVAVHRILGSVGIVSFRVAVQCSFGTAGGPPPKKKNVEAKIFVIYCE